MPTFSGIVVPTGADVSGRRTLLDIVDDLARPVDASDTTVRAICGDAFRSAVRTMNVKGNWPWEIVDEDVAITANQRFSTVSARIKKPLAMHYLSEAGGVRDQRIGYLSYDRFMEMFDQNIDGEAHTYTIPNLFETRQVLWFPRPTADESARFTYYRVTPAPRVEAEAVEIPDFALEVYMSFARYELTKRLPAMQAILPIGVALSDTRLAFREMSAHVATSGDRSREVYIHG